MRSFSQMVSGLAAVALSFGSAALGAESLQGRWDATLTANGAVIPFRLDISGEGATLKGTLYNGDDPEYTTKASFNNGKLVLDMEHYLTKITATLKDGELDGKIQMRGDQGP